MTNLTPDPRESQTFVFHETRFRKIILAVARFVFSIVTDLDVRGIDNLPAHGACVLASNHNSNFDSFILQLVMDRPLFFMGKAELFQKPVLSWAYRQLGAFPVNRGASDTWALDHARKVLDKGLVLAMYPEGTRSRGHGLAVAKTGAARLAIEKNAVIVPASLLESEKVFKRFPKRTKITICFCPAITPVPGDDPLAITDQLMFAIAQTLPSSIRMGSTSSARAILKKWPALRKAVMFFTTERSE